jgi:hypothetical protein
LGLDFPVETNLNSEAHNGAVHVGARDHGRPKHGTIRCKVEFNCGLPEDVLSTQVAPESEEV